MNDAPSASLVAAWDGQAEWSSRASTLKAAINRDRQRLLALTSATAVCGAAGAVLAGNGFAGVAGQWAAGLSAVLAAVTATSQLISGKVNRVEQWSRARSVSEGLKEACYRYRSGTGVYAGSDPDEVLRSQLELVTRKNQDLLAVLPAPVRATKPPPPVLDLPAYIDKRITNQVDGYYLKQVTDLSRRRDRWQLVQRALLYLSATLGAAAAIWPGAGSAAAAWVAVLTTMVGSVGAHIEGSRFDHLIVAYRSTADRLAALRSRHLDDLSKGRAVDFGALVDAAEDAISVENQAWMAGWSTRTAQAGA
jgi:SMODS and SLOG-associating 2TM effector domain 1/Protein of unknown function (DUF4231)